MFGFGKKKNSEVAQLVSMAIANASTTAGKPIQNSDPAIVQLGKKLTSAWFESLPAEVIKDCQPSVLAAFVMIGEARVYAQESGSRSTAEMYVEAAKMVMRGLGLRGASESDLKLVRASAQMADAEGLDFYSEVLKA